MYHLLYNSDVDPSMKRKDKIEQLINQSIQPLFLKVEDESHKHHVPDDAQTHFKVTAVSSVFKGLSLIKRHRMVNQLLVEEFQQGLHALSMHLYTEEEWESRNNSTLNSPACKDGYQN